ncbi:hypothetical protein [Cupriavidus campinensis]|nr:hypothetical protein [Cupriavidus campinensis]
MLHWLIQLALQHGVNWRARAGKSLDDLLAATRRADLGTDA